MDDLGIGRPRTLEERLSEVERKLAIIFKYCPSSPNQTEYSAKPRKRGKKYE